MKTNFFLFAMAILAILFTACDSDDPAEPTPPGDTKVAFVEASSGTIWHYFSFAKNDTIGSGNDSKDAEWATRKDWDIAIRGMYVRSNSGTSTTSGAKGGLFSFDGNDKLGNPVVTISFASVANVPDTAVFVPDAMVSYENHSGTITTSQSKANVVAMKKDQSGSSIMPPAYLKTPVYIFRSADGNNYYKVNFIQYKDENNKSGQVKFEFAQIYKN